ncbi:hypothetical protein FRB90_000941 [Tulasnella sp. 427]|nr:hypothetical protein FRB90_000941 [Tulasnella sp. 427]
MSSSTKPLATSTVGEDEFLSPTPAAATTPAAAAPPTAPLAWVTFSGDGPAVPFIQNVQRIAFSQNRVEDDRWIAQYASTCFSDSSMVWYFGLDEATQSSWVKLRVALVKQYPITPPPSAPAPTPSRPSTSSASTSVPRDIGVVEVLRPGHGDVIGYLSQDRKGRIVMEPSSAKAVQVQKVLYQASKSQNSCLYSLKMLNALNPKFPFIALKLVTFPKEELDQFPEWDPIRMWWGNAHDVPPCCKPGKGFRDRMEESYFMRRSTTKKKTEFAAWSFTPSAESRPEAIYMRKAEGQDSNIGVVSAIWSLKSKEKSVGEIGLVWPLVTSESCDPPKRFDINLEAVVHKGEHTGLHVHPIHFVKESSHYLDESSVTLLFKPTNNLDTTS